MLYIITGDISLPSLNDFDLESEASATSAISQQLHHALRLVSYIAYAIFIFMYTYVCILGKLCTKWLAEMIMILSFQAYYLSHVQGRLQPKDFHSC